MSNESSSGRRKHLPGDKRAAIVTVLACFGFFHYQTWIGLSETSRGLLVLVVVEVLIGAFGSVWIWEEQRRAKASKQLPG